MRAPIVALGLVVGLLAATRADARTATGYKDGKEVKLQVSSCGDAECEIHTAAAFRTMQRAARKAGVDLKVRSGFRTFAKQAALYKKYRSGSGNLAAPAGYSNHESGRALDLYIDRGDKALEWLEKNASHYGFARTVPGEAWHWEYLGGGDKERKKRPTS